MKTGIVVLVLIGLTIVVVLVVRSKKEDTTKKTLIPVKTLSTAPILNTGIPRTR